MQKSTISRSKAYRSQCPISVSMKRTRNINEEKSNEKESDNEQETDSVIYTSYENDINADNARDIEIC